MGRCHHRVRCSSYQRLDFSSSSTMALLHAHGRSFITRHRNEQSNFQCAVTRRQGCVTDSVKFRRADQ